MNDMSVNLLSYSDHVVVGWIWQKNVMIKILHGLINLIVCGGRNKIIEK